MDLLHRIRPFIMPTLVGLVIICIVLGLFTPWFYWGLVVTGPLLLLGLYDRFQKKHSILRNYPVLGRMRFLLEGAGPKMHQYFVESNTSGKPFDRDFRTLIYQRAKNIDGIKPFGTELDVYAQGYGFITHSVSPTPIVEDAGRNVRIDVGGPQCKKPYSSSVINISAMSFGALSANAIRALNTGAKMGGGRHEDVRRRAIPSAQGGLRRDAASRRSLARVADHVRRA